MFFVFVVFFSAEKVTPAIATSTIASAAVAVAVVPAGDLKPIEKVENTPESSFTPKEQEIISTVANIKKESNAPIVSDNSSEYMGKKVSMVIKKEPSDESTESNSNNSSSNSNSNSNSNSIIGGKDNNAEAPGEIKLANEIKTESKCGLDLSDSNNKHEDASRSAFEPHIKFNVANKLPPETQVKFNPELSKPMEPFKFGLDPALTAKYPPMAADLSQKYEPKLFSDQLNKFNENETKDKPSLDGE